MHDKLTNISVDKNHRSFSYSLQNQRRGVSIPNNIILEQGKKKNTKSIFTFSYLFSFGFKNYICFSYSSKFWASSSSICVIHVIFFPIFLGCFWFWVWFIISIHLFLLVKFWSWYFIFWIFLLQFTNFNSMFSPWNINKKYGASGL